MVNREKISTYMLYMHRCIFTFDKVSQSSSREIITLLMANIHATLIEEEANCKVPLKHCIHIENSALLVKGYKCTRCRGCMCV